MVVVPTLKTSRLGPSQAVYFNARKSLHIHIYVGHVAKLDMCNDPGPSG